MRYAWRFVKEYGFTMSEAMKRAWMQFKLKAMMQAGVAEFFFKTISGHVIHAYGTLLNTPKTKGVRNNSDTCVTFYDIEVQGWRSYRIENLIKFVC